MSRIWPMFVVAVIAAQLAPGADPAKPAISKVIDEQLSMIESELVPLAEAMPADRYGFAPTEGAFQGARTFALQVRHTSALIYMFSASVLEEPNPSEEGENQNGPASLRTKEELVKYLKAAFAYGHKAMKSLTAQNLTDMVNPAYGNNKVPRAAMANGAVWHTWDHYGQMAVYARMNGIVPPASR